MLAVYAFRDDTGEISHVQFMGTVYELGDEVATTTSVMNYIKQLDHDEKWPESCYAFIINLRTLEVMLLDHDEEIIGSGCSLTETIEAAIQSFYV
jgi:hypothetical protein|tara:strand:+ start:256 stop:540 length:285 start_codon:yes stop_codon:yes gene_type:complete